MLILNLNKQFNLERFMEVIFVRHQQRQKPLFCQKEISPKSTMVQLYDFLQLWNIKEPKCISFKVLEQEVVVKAFKFFSLAHPI